MWQNQSDPMIYKVNLDKRKLKNIVKLMISRHVNWIMEMWRNLLIVGCFSTRQTGRCQPGGNRSYNHQNKGLSTDISPHNDARALVRSLYLHRQVSSDDPIMYSYVSDVWRNLNTTSLHFFHHLSALILTTWVYFIQFKSHIQSYFDSSGCLIHGPCGVVPFMVNMGVFIVIWTTENPIWI
jgi:hypothetical protein